MSFEKITALRAKVIARKRTTIKGDEVMESDQRSYVDSQLDFSKDILSKERQWKTRSSILQSSGKVWLAVNYLFAPNIMWFSLNRTLRKIYSVFCNPLKQGRMEANKVRSKYQVNLLLQLDSFVIKCNLKLTFTYLYSLNQLKPPKPAQPPVIGYSRYDQERFRNKEDTEGFKIDTMETFHGMTLKSVTEGVSARKSQETAHGSSHDRSTNSSSVKPISQARPPPNQKKGLVVNYIIYWTFVVWFELHSSTCYCLKYMIQYIMCIMWMITCDLFARFQNTNHYYTSCNNLTDNNVQCQRYSSRAEVSSNFFNFNICEFYYHIILQVLEHRWQEEAGC